MGGDGNAYASVCCGLREGLDGDAGAVGTHTAVVLLVAFLLGVARVKAGDAVVVVAAVFAQLIREGEADVAPGGIVTSDVHPGGFDALGDDFNVIRGISGQSLGWLCILGSLLLCRLFPFFWIERLFHYLRA